MLRYYTDFLYENKPCFISLSRTYLFVYRIPIETQKSQPHQILSYIFNNNISPFQSLPITKSKDIFIETLKTSERLTVLFNGMIFDKKHYFTYDSSNSSLSIKLTNFYIDIITIKNHSNWIFSTSDLDTFVNSTDK